MKYRAGSRLALNLNITAHFLHDSVADRQTQTCACTEILRRKKRIENRTQVLPLDTLAGIPQRNNDLPRFRTRGQVQLTTVYHGLYRVIEQIDQHLLEFHRIAQYARQFLIQVEVQVNTAGR